MRANLYNEVAENLEWFETYTDECGRKVISITASLENEENINRVLVVAA